MKRIAIVEDEAMMREELSGILEKAGYQTVEITEFSDVAKQLLEILPDLVLLDLNLPGANGFEICRDMKRNSPAPILVLTSRDKLCDELCALDLGADEYLTKPCGKERLLARISNVMKRFEGRVNLLEGKGFLLDRQTYTIYIENRSVVLPKNQGKMLELFLAKGEEAVSREELFQKLWGTTEFIDENALWVNLTRLKKTMKQLGMKQRIVSVRGVGYRMQEKGDAV